MRALPSTLLFMFSFFIVSQPAKALVACAPTSCSAACDSSCTYQACDGTSSVAVAISQLPIIYSTPADACADGMPSPVNAMPVQIDGAALTRIPQTISHPYNVCATHVTYGPACPPPPPDPLVQNPQPQPPQPPPPQPPPPQPPQPPQCTPTTTLGAGNGATPVYWGAAACQVSCTGTYGPDASCAGGCYQGYRNWMYCQNCVRTTTCQGPTAPPTNGRWQSTFVRGGDSTNLCPFHSTNPNPGACSPVGSYCNALGGDLISGGIYWMRFNCQ